jgi:pimeloyl-ACP methyl ester carboxylesterase
VHQVGSGLHPRSAAGTRQTALRSVASVLIALSVAACQAVPAPAPRSPVETPSPAPASPTSPAATPLARSFDVGGHSLYLECAGTGSPTIVFLHGIGGDRTHGDALLRSFSGRLRVCTYDRANMGLSDRVEGVLLGADAANDLGALLAAADIAPPYVLVAGSFGGLVALIYAAGHPKDVAGIVFVDASLPSDADVDQLLVDRGLIGPIKPTDEYANNGESFRYSVVEEARVALAAIPEVPISYLRSTESEDIPGWPVKEMQAIGQHGIDTLLAHSSDGKQVDVDGPHFPFPQQAVDDEVRRVLDLIAPS